MSTPKFFPHKKVYSNGSHWPFNQWKASLKLIVSSISLIFITAEEEIYNQSNGFHAIKSIIMINFWFPRLHGKTSSFLNEGMEGDPFSVEFRVWLSNVFELNEGT